MVSIIFCLFIYWYGNHIFVYSSGNILCQSWNSNTLATSCKELTHWKRLWCWEGLRTGGEGNDRGWDGWMASPTQWTWVWVNFGSWWWTGRPGMLQFMGLQRVGHDWATELNKTDIAQYINRWIAYLWRQVIRKKCRQNSLEDDNEKQVEKCCSNMTCIY